jgi:hypothetical protein
MNASNNQLYIHLSLRDEENSGDVMLPLDEPGEAICFWAKPFFGGSIPKNL